MKTRALALTIALTAAAVGVGLGLAQDAGAANNTNCPPAPASGTVVNGNLTVTGACIVENVTITGNVIINSGGALELDKSVVQGSVTVNSGGEFESGAKLGVGSPNGKESVVRGRVIYAGNDMDFIGGGIQGSAPSLFFDGTNTGHFPKVCGAGITPNGLTVKNVPAGKSFRLGDPDGDDGSSACTADSIRGNVLFQGNAGTLVLEGAGIVGNVTIDSSTVKFADNVVRGNLICQNGGHVANASGNSVTGTHSTCGPI